MAVYKSKDLNKNKKSTDGRYASPPKIGKTPKYKTDGRYALPIKKTTDGRYTRPKKVNMGQRIDVKKSRRKKFKK